MAQTTIELGSKGGRVVTAIVDFAKLMESQTFVEQAVKFAIKQALTNTHAGIKKDAENAFAESQALVDKRLAVMESGQWGSVGGFGGTDPVEREIRLMAEAVVNTAMKAKGIKRTKGDGAKYRGLVDKIIEKRGEEFRPQAEAKVAAVREVETDGLDLDDLFGGE